MAPEAPTAPAPERNEWARVTEAGVLKATELWEAARVLAGVALPARGDWDGLFPTQRVWLSDVMASPKRPKFMNREWKKEDITYAAVLGATHIAACFAPFCFSWCVAAPSPPPLPSPRVLAAARICHGSRTALRTVQMCWVC
jgi:hypothetical protein